MIASSRGSETRPVRAGYTGSMVRSVLASQPYYDFLMITSKALSTRIRGRKTLPWYERATSFGMLETSYRNLQPAFSGPC